jgi:hypothetical protein
LGITDAAGELSAFFCDRDGYRARHGSRIVPLLIKRGQAAQRAGDTVGAAADFNRALAYSPKDPVLLKIITGLRRGKARKKALTVGLLVLVGSAFLGAAGVSIGRMASHEQQATSTRLSAKAATGSAVAHSADQPTPAPAACVRPAPPALPPPRAERAKRGEPLPAAYKDVLFKVRPQGALVSIDGGPLEAPPFGQTKRLAVGPHTFRAEVPKSRCCKALTKFEEIRPDDGSGRPQEVVLSLEFREAILSAPDAPSGATISCPLLGVSGPASQVLRIPMQASDVPISCDLDAPGLHRSAIPVTLRAGEPTNVPWPAP